MSASQKSTLKTWAAIVALWAPVYLALIEGFGLSSMPRSELLQWALVFIGVSGLGSVLYTAWKDTRDPAWRAAHRLPPLDAAPTPVAATSPALAKAELQAGA
jgi:hypothetical protein